MRLSRLVPALAAGTLLVASTSPVLAEEPAPAPGVGTTTGSLTLLGLDAGDLLRLDLLSDSGRASTDPASGVPAAAAQIAALALETVGSAPLSVPLFSVESTGDEQAAEQDVSLPATPLLSGSVLPMSVRALVGGDGATSALRAQLTELDVLGGLLGLTGAVLDLGGTAQAADAAATRGVAVQDLELLDLEALLGALGIDLADLPLDRLLGLLDGLGLLDRLPLDQLGISLDDLSVDGLLAVVDGLLDRAAPLLDRVDVLTGQLGQLQTAVDQITAGGSTVCTTVLGPIGGLLGGIPVAEVCTSVTGAVSTLTSEITSVRATLDNVQEALDPLLAQLRGLLTGDGGVLDLLGGASLLSVDGLDVEVLTRATDDLATSVADVTATLGSLQVGALPTLPPVDLGAGAERIQAVLGQVEEAIGGILGRIAPSLTDLISVRSLEERTSVVEEAGRVVADADFTGLAIEVQPVLAELQELLGSLGGAGSLGGLLGSLDLVVPPSGAGGVLDLNDAIAGATGDLPLLGGLAALGEALTVRVASVSQQSVFGASAVPVAPGTPGAPAAPAAPGPAPTLPRTGSSDTLVLGLAMAAAAVALTGRHLLRRNAG